MIYSYNNTNSNVSFGINYKSPKLNFCRDDFFIRIRGYGKNDEWVSHVKKTAEETALLIRENAPFEDVLRYIAQGMKEANRFTLDLGKRFYTGLIRTSREGWLNISDWKDMFLYTPYGQGGHFRYKSYEQRLNEIIKHPIKNSFKDIELTRPQKGKKRNYLKHANGKYISPAFSHIEKLYNYIVENFVKNEVKTEDLPTVNSLVAQIRWILAHSTPWERGSDAISNVFMKALYKSMGIKTSRPTKGISFDMEAYCRSLDDYTKNFTSFFEKAHEIIE